MEEIMIYEKMGENLQELLETQKEITMTELAIYEKNIEILKNEKINEMNQFFISQAKFYNQKKEKYEEEVNKYIKDYKQQLENVIEGYNNLFVNIVRMMQNATQNQQIAIANIVKLKQKLNKQDIGENEKQKIEKMIMACAQKKLNYSVIVDECEARIKWCIENSKKDINEIFTISMYQMQVYKENIITKIRRIIFNKISGKGKYKRFLTDFENGSMKEIKDKSEVKIFNIACILSGVKKQIRQVKKEIKQVYNQAVNA